MNMFLTMNSCSVFKKHLLFTNTKFVKKNVLYENKCDFLSHESHVQYKSLEHKGS